MIDILGYLVYIINPLTIIMATTYSIEGAFRYEFKNKKATYITSAIMAAVTVILVEYALIVLKIDIIDAGGLIIGVEDVIRVAGLFVHFIFLVVMLKGKVWKRFLALFLSTEILGSVNHIIESVVIQVNRLNEIEDQERVVIMLLITELVAAVADFLFLYIIAKVRKKNDNTPLPLPVLGVVAIFLLLVNAFLADDSITDEIYVGNDFAKQVLLILILITVWLFFFLRVTRKERDGLKQLNKINEELVDSQTKFFEASAKADSEIRAMRHDMRNNVQVLMLLLANKEYDKMQEYLEEMSEGLAGTNVSSHTGDVIADAIITDKKKRAAAAGLKLDVTGAISGVEISPVNMCKMLGNLLDNAIEAAAAPDLKDLAPEYKVIDLQFKHTENFFMISVTNPCSEKPDIKDGKIVTSKSDKKNHGFGISNIRSAAEDCGGELSVSCEEKPFGFLFRAEVVI